MGTVSKRRSELGAEATEPSPGERGRAKHMTSMDQRRKRAAEIDAVAHTLIEAERAQRSAKTERLRAARLAANRK